MVIKQNRIYLISKMWDVIALIGTIKGNNVTLKILASNNPNTESEITTDIRCLRRDVIREVKKEELSQFKSMPYVRSLDG
jgi:hypothetical protein